MADSPNPDTLPSAIHADPLARLRREIMAEMRGELRRSRPPVVSIHDEPDPKSAVRKAAESRWTPVGVATLIAALSPLITSWVDSNRQTVQDIDMSRKLDAIAQRIGELETAHGETAKRVQGIVDSARDTQLSELKRRLYEDAAMCRLGIVPPGGECPDIEFRRRRTSTGVRAQPSVEVPPLPPAPE